MIDDWKREVRARLEELVDGLVVNGVSYEDACSMITLQLAPKTWTRIPLTMKPLMNRSMTGRRRKKEDLSNRTYRGPLGKFHEGPLEAYWGG